MVLGYLWEGPHPHLSVHLQFLPIIDCRRGSYSFLHLYENSSVSLWTCLYYYPCKSCSRMLSTGGGTLAFWLLSIEWQRISGDSKSAEKSHINNSWHLSHQCVQDIIRPCRSTLSLHEHWIQNPASPFHVGRLWEIELPFTARLLMYFSRLGSFTIL